MAMDKIINANFDKAFSDTELTKLCDEEVNIVPYDELHKFNSIDEAFDGHPAIALLYLTGKNYGHWVAIIDHGNYLEYFDPYGMKVDGGLGYVGSIDWKRQTNQDYKYLTQLLDSQDKPVVYNNHKLQKVKKDTSTCGRWVGLRIACRDIPLDTFIKMFTDPKNKFSADYYVTCFTMFI